VPVLGIPDAPEVEMVPHDEPSPPPQEETTHVPLAVLLRERETRQEAQRKFEELQREREELARWRQEYEPVLDEARRIWPEMQQQAQQVPQLQQQLEQARQVVEFYKGHLDRAKEEYGLEVDDQSYFKDLQLKAALDRLSNIDQTINSALAAQLNEREAMFAYQQQQQAQQHQAEQARRDRDQAFEQQFGELVKAAPQLATFRKAVRTEWEENPARAVREVAQPLVETFVSRSAVQQDNAARMVRTQGASSGSRPSVGHQTPGERYKGMGVKEIVASRRRELRGQGLL
jgi:uncharacterized protein